MKTRYFVLPVLAIALLSSFSINDACEYAGSNIGYVKTQTQTALDDNDLNKAKFLTYKAIRAIYKLRGQLDECGCEEAAINIEESQYHLIKATKATSIQEAKASLIEAYNKTVASLEAITRHHLHKNSEIGNDLVLNKLENREKINLSIPHLDKEVLHVMIDDSLIPFEVSLHKVVDSVNCKDARAFAERIFQICEQELLKNNLSEGKKYYNLRTQEITADALRKLGDCGAVYYQCNYRSKSSTILSIIC